MAYLRKDFKFLLREENRRKEEMRKERAAQKKKKVKEIINKLVVTEKMLNYSKAALKEDSFSEQLKELYINSLKWMIQRAEEYRYQLFDITGNPSYLIDIDKLYRGLC